MVQRTHPRMYGGRSDDSFPTILTHTVHPRVHGARMHQHLLQNHPGMAHPRVYGADAISLSRVPLMLRFIPAYTGQIGTQPQITSADQVHPRVYGADTKFLKRIPVISKPFFCLGLPQQNQYASFWPSIFLRITLFGQYWPEMIHILVIAVW